MLNWGCIPTKSLLRSSEIKHLLDNSNSFGFTISDYKINFDDIIKRSRSVAKTLSSGVSHLMKKNKIKVFFGLAKIIDSSPDDKKIEVNNTQNELTQLNCKYLVIATDISFFNFTLFSKI